MKKVEERTTPDLLELTLQLHSRALNQPNNKEMHDAYVEARQELEKRLSVNENAVLRSVRLMLPTTKEIRDAREDYDKRAYAGHFAGDEPWKHFHAGVEWMLGRIEGN